MLLSLIPGDVNFTEVWNIFRLEIKELQVISSSFLSGFSLILITPPPPFFPFPQTTGFTFLHPRTGEKLQYLVRLGLVKADSPQRSWNLDHVGLTAWLCCPRCPATKVQGFFHFFFRFFLLTFFPGFSSGWHLEWKFWLLYTSPSKRSSGSRGSSPKIPDPRTIFADQEDSGISRKSFTIQGSWFWSLSADGVWAISPTFSGGVAFLFQVLPFPSSFFCSSSLFILILFSYLFWFVFIPFLQASGQGNSSWRQGFGEFDDPELSLSKRRAQDLFRYCSPTSFSNNIEVLNDDSLLLPRCDLCVKKLQHVFDATSFERFSLYSVGLERQAPADFFLVFPG